MELTLTSGRLVTLKDCKSRKIDRDYQMALADGVMVGQDGSAQFPANNVQKANDALVMGMTGLSQADLDNLSVEDYSELQTAIEDQEQKKSQPKSSSTK
jgi:hypothetical protein